MEQIQGAAEKFQAKLQALTVEVESGAGMVRVTMNGERKIVQLSLDPGLLEKEDKAFLEDLVVAAVNKASEAVDKRIQELMAGEPFGSLASFMPGAGL